MPKRVARAREGLEISAPASMECNETSSEREGRGGIPFLLLLPLPFAVSVVTVALARRRRFPLSLSFSFSLFPPSRRESAKLTTPSAVRVSRLARWSNWNTPSPREPVQRSSVVCFVFGERERERLERRVQCLPLLFLCSSLSAPRATPFRRAHSRSLVPLVLLARSPNAGTAAIFGWWKEGEKEGG